MIILLAVGGYAVWYLFGKVDEITEVPCEDDPSQDWCAQNCEVEITWGDCTSPCGGGTQTGVVDITRVEEYGGTCLYTYSGETTTRNCNIQLCGEPSNGLLVGGSGSNPAPSILPFYADNRTEFRLFSPREIDDYDLKDNFSFHGNQLAIPNPGSGRTRRWPIYVFTWTGSNWDPAWKTIEAPDTPYPNTGHSEFGKVVALYSGTLITFNSYHKQWVQTSGGYLPENAHELLVYSVAGADVIENQVITIDFDIDFIKFDESGNRFIASSRYGDAMVYKFMTNEWQVQQQFSVPGIVGDVCIYEDYLAISDTSDSNGQGRVVIYKYNNTTSVWGEHQTLRAGNQQNWSFFGQSIAMTTERVFVGSSVSGVNSSSGAVYMFSLYASGGGVSFTQTSKILPSGTRTANDHGFGISLDIQDNILVVGSDLEVVEGVPNTGQGGAVYVFVWSDAESAWSEYRIIPGDRQYNMFFGSTVVLYDNLLIVGSPGYDHSDSTETGLIYAYTNFNTVSG
jgi:hypothetical protein